MFPVNAYVIRRATEADGPTLRRLAWLDSRRPIEGPALIGEIAGRPAAAICLNSGRVVADPFQATANLTALLKVRMRALHAYDRTPSLRDRMLAGVRITGAWRATA